MSSRDANLLGACALAVAGRLPASAADTALVALDGWLAGSTVDRLARVLALTHSGAVRLTDRLAGDGLVERRTGADARSRALYVTPAGAAARKAERSRWGYAATGRIRCSPMVSGSAAEMARRLVMT